MCCTDYFNFNFFFLVFLLFCFGWKGYNFVLNLHFLWVTLYAPHQSFLSQLLFLSSCMVVQAIFFARIFHFFSLISPSCLYPSGSYEYLGSLVCEICLLLKCLVAKIYLYFCKQPLQADGFKLISLLVSWWKHFTECFGYFRGMVNPTRKTMIQWICGRN